MKRGSIAAICLLAFLGTTSVALANGAEAEFPEGGVVFKHSKQISIAREDLTIGANHITVHYVFHSSASRPLKRTIGFPTAKVTEGDEINGGRSDSFEVRVSGRTLKPKYHEYAWLNGANITRKLRRMGVPIDLRPKDHLHKITLFSKGTLRRLQRDKLIDIQEGYFEPNWDYQRVYEWTQTFAPGTTQVDITYEPLIGDGGQFLDYTGKDSVPSYCIADATVARLEKLVQSNVLEDEPARVGYILQTARNWNGPIGEFHLKVAEKNALSRFCVPAGLKAVGNGRWMAKNFVPQSNLEIMFLFYAKDAEPQ